MEKAINNLVFLNPPGVLEIILFLLFALVVLYGSYRSTRFLTDPKKKYALIALHIVSFLLITFILLNPALRKESYKEDKKNLALVVDSSFSMELSGDEDGNTRIEKVRAYLDNNQEFLEEIEENYIVRYYSFDETLERHVALKVIRPDLGGGAETQGQLVARFRRARFRRSARS